MGPRNDCSVSDSQGKFDQNSARKGQTRARKTCNDRTIEISSSLRTAQIAVRSSAATNATIASSTAREGSERSGRGSLKIALRDDGKAVCRSPSCHESTDGCYEKATRRSQSIASRASQKSQRTEKRGRISSSESSLISR